MTWRRVARTATVPAVRWPAGAGAEAPPAAEVKHATGISCTPWRVRSSRGELRPPIGAMPSRCMGRKESRLRTICRLDKRIAKSACLAPSRVQCRGVAASVRQPFVVGNPKRQRRARCAAPTVRCRSARADSPRPVAQQLRLDEVEAPNPPAQPTSSPFPTFACPSLAAQELVRGIPLRTQHLVSCRRQQVL